MVVQFHHSLCPGSPLSTDQRTDRPDHQKTLASVLCHYHHSVYDLFFLLNIRRGSFRILQSPSLGEKIRPYHTDPPEPCLPAFRLSHNRRDNEAFSERKSKILYRAYFPGAVSDPRIFSHQSLSAPEKTVHPCAFRTCIYMLHSLCFPFIPHYRPFDTAPPSSQNKPSQISDGSHYILHGLYPVFILPPACHRLQK